jgi:hypothetical protein
LDCVLARRVIAADDKPTLKEVGYLAQINEDRVNDPKALREFWRRARSNLGRLRVQPNQIALIEAASQSACHCLSRRSMCRSQPPLSSSGSAMWLLHLPIAYQHEAVRDQVSQSRGKRSRNEGGRYRHRSEDSQDHQRSPGARRRPG